MVIALMLLLLLSAVVEFFGTSLPRGHGLQAAAGLAIIMISFASGGLVVAQPNVASIALLIVSAYRIVNSLRLADMRMQEDYLRRTVRQTGMWLLALQAVILLAWCGADRYNMGALAWLAVLIFGQVFAALVLLASTVRHLRTTKIRPAKLAIADKDLPAITVAVPARNEDEQLDACLQSILASDYPKFEVIVLDDCSQDRTPQIIRDFAHDGVRFVPGEDPRANWLAKNQAYDRLSKEASGDIVVFCGVDVRFAPGSLRQLITSLITKKKVMMSVMPINDRVRLPLPQSMRYMWELALPRRLFNRPPVLSSCWLIKAEVLKRLGGFAAVSRAITPEAYFAREAIRVNDGYSFVRSDNHLGLTSTKTRAEQRATAIRTRYPSLHRRLELTMLLSVFEVALLFGPFALALVGAGDVFGLWLEAGALVGAALLLAAYRGVIVGAFPRRHLLLLLAFPWAVLSDVALLNYSMWQYEFSEVIWKNRNICLPVMRRSGREPASR